MTIKKVRGPFCKYCGDDDIYIEDMQLEDGDDQYMIYKEWCTCNNCGKDFMRIMEWKLSGFTFYKDGDSFGLEDIDYEIEEE